MSDARSSGPSTGASLADGIILLDKPTGLSSNAALQRVKRFVGAAKAGHAGTLDPLATGMLPILLGEATKVAGYLLHKDKAYRVECRLGQTTTSYDSDGEIVTEKPVPVLDANSVNAQLAPFLGRIRQQAPIYSAIKQGGQPLYKRARRGEDVVAPVREVMIHAIAVDAMAGDSLTMTVECGSGTYIRSLVHDLGQALGCGAHVTALRRLWVAPFRDTGMVTLERLGEGGIEALPPLAAIADWPRIDLTAGELLAIEQGRRVDHAPGPAGLVAGIAPDGQLAAILERDERGSIRCQRLLHRRG